MRAFLVLICIALILGPTRATISQTENQQSGQGRTAAWVQNRETAMEIGKAIVRERMGEAFVREHEPFFKAELSPEGIWKVRTGYNPRKSGFEAEIYVLLRRSNGEIIDVGVSP
jgi:hypothetical protein